MSRFRFLLLLVICNPSFSQTSDNTEQTIIKIEGQRMEAIGARNHDVLMSLYDEKYHGVLASGRSVDKSQMIEFLETSSPHIVQSIEDLKVTVHGTVAVSTGKTLNRSKSGSVIGQSRFIRVYVNRGDQWKIVESQGTVIIQE